MEIGDALVAYLLAYPGLAALIGTKLEPDSMPPGAALPYVTYMTVSDVKDHTLQGISELEHPVYQFTSYATTKASARAIVNQIKAALSDYHGTMSGVTVQYIQLVNELPSSYVSADGLIKTFTHDLEFKIYYEKE